MDYKPTKDRVLIKFDEAPTETKTEAGLIIPQESDALPYKKAIVIAVGEDVPNLAHDDVIIINKACSKIKIEDYYLIAYDSVLAEVID